MAKCKNHSRGPADSKYCGNGGVYYTYNFIEDGSDMGHVDYPWGGDKLKRLNLDLKVSNRALPSIEFSTIPNINYSG